MIDEDDLLDPTLRAPIARSVVQRAAAAIDGSRLVELLEYWEDQDRVQVGGRTPHLNMRATLTLWLINAMEHAPMHIRSVERMLRHRMTPKTSADLEIAYEPLAPPEAWYERMRRATNRITRLMDAYPLKNRQRRLTRAEYDEELRFRAANQGVLEQRLRRARIFRNQMMEATYQMLPAEHHPERMSICVDATRTEVHARGISRKKVEALPPHAKVSSEPDFGFYQRNYKGKPTGENAAAAGNPVSAKGDVRISEYAVEYEIAVLCATDLDTPDSVPPLIVAMDCHVPGSGDIDAARVMVDSLDERGHQLDTFAADRAYMPKGHPDRLMNPLRERGVKLVMDYPSDELGVQGQKDGALLIDGNWYGPCIPRHLIDATKVHSEGVAGIKHSKEPAHISRRQAADDALQKAIVARETYLLREKERPDDRGRSPHMCPAAGPAPTVTCDLKPNPRSNGRSLLPILNLNLPKAPGKICSNKTSTSFALSDGGRHGQYYQYKSVEWSRHYDHLRNQVESMNQVAKNEATFAIAQPQRRRLRGRTAQAFLITMAFTAINLELIRRFLLERLERREDEIDGIPSPRTKTNRSRRSSPEARLSVRRHNRKKRPATAGALRT